MAQTHITLAKAKAALTARTSDPVVADSNSTFVPPKGAYKKDDGKYYRFGKLLPGQ